MLNIKGHCRSCAFWKYNHNVAAKQAHEQGGFCLEGDKSIILTPGEPRMDLRSGQLVPQFNVQTFWPYTAPNDQCGRHHPDGVTVEPENLDEPVRLLEPVK